MTAKKTKCITVTDDQDQKIRAIQMRRMLAEKKTISYSSVLHECIAVGLEKLA